MCAVRLRACGLVSMGISFLLGIIMTSGTPENFRVQAVLHWNPVAPLLRRNAPSCPFVINRGISARGMFPATGTGNSPCEVPGTGHIFRVPTSAHQGLIHLPLPTGNIYLRKIICPDWQPIQARNCWGWLKEARGWSAAVNALHCSLWALMDPTQCFRFLDIHRLLFRTTFRVKFWITLGKLW